MGKKPFFDISASVIRQLGEELVTDEVTAVMELIKNSYDADADWVSVEVNLNDIYDNANKYYKDSSKGFIAIRDNGFGMSDSDIWNSWMKISLSFKKKFKTEGRTTPKGRTPLGEKGVGRLSTQRLGSRLELFTGKAGDDKQSHVAFDWDQFDDDTSLTSVPVYINDFPKPKVEKGTTLVLTNLKESNKWKGDSWARFRGQISQMIFPFKEKRIFNVYLKLNGQNVDLDEVNERVRDNSVAKYSFKLKDYKIILDGKIKLAKLNGGNARTDLEFFESKILPDFGKDFFEFLTDEKNNKKNFIPNLTFSKEKGNFISFHRELDLATLSNIAYVDDYNEIDLDDDSSEADLVLDTFNENLDEPNIILAYPGDFEGEINDFYFKESDEIQKVFDSFSEFKKLVQNQIGVRLFRDGFGIKPYGIDGQDWLKLSSNQTTGSSFYGLRPANVVGFVTISAKDNRNLKEKTDREGFVDSPYSRNFFRSMDYFISEINNVLEGTRRSYTAYRSKKAEESSGIKNISQSFTTLKRTSDNAKKSSERAGVVKYNLSSIANQIKLITEKKSPNSPDNSETNNLLSTVVKLLADAESLLSEVESMLDDAKILDQHVEYLQPQIRNLEQQLSDFSQLAGLGLTAEALSHELSNIVDRLIEETEQINIKLKSKNDPDNKQVKMFLEQVRNSTRSFRKQLSHLAPSLRYVRENKDEINVVEYIEEIRSYYIDRFRGEIVMETDIESQNFILHMNKGKLTQIIDNIVLNSEFWLKEKKKSDPLFKPVITIEAQSPFIRIFDNGLGVEPTLEDRIFQPFVTGKQKGQGRGLGLFIIQQLLESLGCDIALLSKRNQFNRKFIFQINLSNVIEE